MGRLAYGNCEHQEILGGDDSHILMATLHKRALSRLHSVGAADHTGRPSQGLHMGGKHLELSGPWVKRLSLWDAHLGMIEKLSVPNVNWWLAELDKEIDRVLTCREIDLTSEPSGAEDSTGSYVARDLLGLWWAEKVECSTGSCINGITSADAVVLAQPVGVYGESLSCGVSGVQVVRNDVQKKRKRRKRGTTVSM